MDSEADGDMLDSEAIPEEELSEELSVEAELQAAMPSMDTAAIPRMEMFRRVLKAMVFLLLAMVPHGGTSWLV